MTVVGRIERDVYGAVRIPEQALYGINTVRTVQNLSFSGNTLGDYPLYVRALSQVKKAAAMANQEAGTLTEHLSMRITKACDQIIKGISKEQFPIDIFHGGGGIGTNMNMNEVIAQLANVQGDEQKEGYTLCHPFEHVNASQSTADVCHTAIRIAIITQFRPLANELHHLIKVLKQKAIEFKDVSTISRTCLQDGVRIQLGDKFGGYVAMVKRRLEELEEAVGKLHSINLGATVIGSGVGAPRTYRECIVSKLKQVTGLQLQHRENLFDAAQNIDDLAHVSCKLHLLAACLLKLGKDLRLLSSGPEAGFSEIQLPAIQAGSSFFPGKVNPVIPETLIQCCFQVFGADRAVQATLEHAELDLNIFEGAAGANILDAMRILEKALSAFTEHCVQGITANVERCTALANSFFPRITALKEKYGYPAVTKLLQEKGLKEIVDYLNKEEEEIDIIK